MNIIGLLVFSLGFLFAGYYSYLAWYQPQKLIALARKRRQNARDLLPILDAIFQYKFFDANPFIDVWLVRVAAPVTLLVASLGIFIEIRGPFP
jgi:hypothetical protein